MESGFRRAQATPSFGQILDLRVDDARDLETIFAGSGVRGMQRLSLVRRLLGSYSMGEIAEGLRELVPWDDRVETTLSHTLYNLRHPEFHPQPFDEPHTPAEIQGYHPGDLATYNDLLEGLL